MGSDQAEAIAAILEHPRTLRLNFSAALVHVHPQMFLDVAAALRAGTIAVLPALEAANRPDAAMAYLSSVNAIAVDKNQVIPQPGTNAGQAFVHEAVHAWCDGHRVNSRLLLEEAAATIAHTAYFYLGWSDDQLDEEEASVMRTSDHVFTRAFAVKILALIRRYSLHHGRYAAVSPADCVDIAEALRHLPSSYADYDHSVRMPSDGWSCGLGCRSKRLLLSR